MAYVVIWSDHDLSGLYILDLAYESVWHDSGDLSPKVEALSTYAARIVQAIMSIITTDE